MLENSKDLLFIVLSFCALWITVFLCWLIYYLVSILRNTNTMVEEMRDRFRGIEETMRSMRDRLEHATSSLGFVSEGVIKLIQFFISRRKSKAETEEMEDLMEERFESKKKRKK
jgi:hypothetical protein